MAVRSWTDDMYLGLVRLWKFERVFANKQGPRSVCDRIDLCINYLVRRRRNKHVYAMWQWVSHDEKPPKPEAERHGGVSEGPMAEPP